MCLEALIASYGYITSQKRELLLLVTGSAEKKIAACAASAVAATLHLKKKKINKSNIYVPFERAPIFPRKRKTSGERHCSRYIRVHSSFRRWPQCSIALQISPVSLPYTL